MTEQFMENISNEEHERLLLLCGHGIGAPLSPATLAVLDAIESRIDRCAALAAALRAVADQVVPKKPTLSYPGDYELGVWVANVDARVGLLAIAAELEGAQ